MGTDIQGWANVFRTPFFVTNGWANFDWKTQCEFFCERHGASSLWERVAARVDFVRQEFLKRESFLKRNQEDNQEEGKMFAWERKNCKLIALFNFLR